MGFNKWRRKLGYTQVEAGEKLGLSRGAVQYWESELRPVPVAVEHAWSFLITPSLQALPLTTFTYVWACPAMRDPLPWLRWHSKRSNE